MNVSAKDKGTGKEQHITITSSTNMSKEDIDKAVKDAEKYAEEDKKQKEAVEVKNKAETIILQSEKTLSDIGDKLYKQTGAQPGAEGTADNGSSEGQNGGTTDGNGNYYSQDFEDKT